MVNEVTSGRWSMHEYIAHGYAFVREAPGDLLNQLRSQVRLRAGWCDLIQTLKASNDRLHVVSNGLDFYIREFLPDSIPLTSFVARYDGRYHIDLPRGCALLPGEEFKVNRVRQLAADGEFGQLVYVGDGRADFAPSLFCNVVCAVRGSRLAQMRQRHSLPTVEFDSFDTVAELVLRHHRQAPTPDPTSPSVLA